MESVRENALRISILIDSLTFVTVYDFLPSYFSIKNGMLNEHEIIDAESVLIDEDLQD